MGLDVYGYVVFGKIFDKKDLEKVTLVRSCEHETDLSKPFCSQCGKKIFEENRESILSKIDRALEKGDGSIQYYDNPDQSNKVVIGCCLASTSSNCGDFYRVSSPTPEMMEKIHRFLEENNLPVGDVQTYLYNYYSI